MLGVFTAGLSLAIGLVFTITAGLSMSLAKLASMILSWVTSSDFIPLSYTNAGVTAGPTFNTFVDLGWQLTRGLTNIIFVFALIAIGLATALRLGGAAYTAKKALPVLAIVALLINFTPVILGVMIDASNIVMNFFLQGTGGFNSLASSFSVIGEQIKQVAGSFFDPAAQLSTVLSLLVITIVSLISAFIMFIFSALFLVRYIAIWLLVILSPLAFACYILPATRKVWSQWWDQFVQWTIIGITGGFFLYLSSKMIELAGGGTSGGGGGFLGFSNKPDTSMLIGNWDNFAAQTLPWFVILFTMLIGLMMSFQTGAMGASAVRQGLSKTGGWLMRRRLAERAKGTLAGVGAAALSGMARGSQRADLFASKLAGKGPLGSLAGGILKPFTLGASKGLGAPRDLFERKMIEYAAGKRKDAIPQNWDAMTDPEKVSDAKSRGMDSDKVQVFAKMAMAADGSLKRLSDEDKKYVGSLARKFAGNDYLTKYTDDIFDVLPTELDENARVKMEARNKKGPAKIDAQNKAREEINKTVKDEEFSTDVILKPVIDKEALRLAEESVGKKEWGAMSQADKNKKVEKFANDVTRNFAAQYLHVKGLKSADIKNLPKDIVKSAIFTRTLRDMTPGHLQAIQENFKVDVSNEVMEKSFNAMFEGKNPDDARNVLDEYAKDPKHARMLQWFATNPAGRAFNWEGLKYMRDAKDEPTSQLGEFQKRMNINKLLEKDPLVKGYYDLQGAMKGLDQARQDIIQKIARNEVVNVAQARRRISDMEREIMENTELLVKNEDTIKKATDSKRIMDEVERLKR